MALSALLWPMWEVLAFPVAGSVVPMTEEVIVSSSQCAVVAFHQFDVWLSPWRGSRYVHDHQ